MTKEAAQIYRIINPSSLEDLANQVNRIFAMQADRKDAIEGYRGTPTFRAEMDMQTHKITQVGAAVNPADAVIKAQTDADYSAITHSHAAKITEAGSATLVLGVATVTTTLVTAASIIIMTPQTDGTHPGSLGVSSRTPAVSFDIESTDLFDDRTIGYIIYEP